LAAVRADELLEERTLPYDEEAVVPVPCDLHQASLPREALRGVGLIAGGCDAVRAS